MPATPRRVLATLLAASLGLPGCSGGGTAPPEPPPPTSLPTGAALDAVLPLHDLAIYHGLPGNQLRVDLATHRDFGRGNVMRVAFIEGARTVGFYISHGDPRGSLMHGAFDTSVDQEVIFRVPQPLWTWAAAGPFAAETFSPIGAATPRAFGQAGTEYVRHPGFLLGPHMLGYPSPFGVWLWGEMFSARWKLTFGPILNQPPLDVGIFSGPGFGPVQYRIGPRSHSVYELELSNNRTSWPRMTR